MIDKLKQLFYKYRQFILFCIVGASNTLITWVVFWLLNQKLGVQYLIAYPIAYALGIINGYLWSTAVVFRKKRSSDNAVKFVLVNLIVWGASQALIYLWVDKLGIREMMAVIITTAFSMVLNFTLNKLWTFREKKDKDSTT